MGPFHFLLVGTVSGVGMLFTSAAVKSIFRRPRSVSTTCTMDKIETTRTSSALEWHDQEQKNKTEDLGTTHSVCSFTETSVSADDSSAESVLGTTVVDEYMNDEINSGSDDLMEKVQQDKQNNQMIENGKEVNSGILQDKSCPKERFNTKSRTDEYDDTKEGRVLKRTKFKDRETEQLLNVSLLESNFYRVLNADFVGPSSRGFVQRMSRKSLPNAMTTKEASSKGGYSATPKPRTILLSRRLSQQLFRSGGQERPAP